MLTRKLRAFRALQPAARHTLVLGMGALPLVALALRAFGLHRVRSMLQPGRGGARAVAGMHPETMAGLVDLAARQLPFAPSCLARAVLTESLIVRAGYDCELRVGVAHAVDGIAAHAWVEHNGRALGPATDTCERYSAFAPLPRALTGRR